MGLIHWFKEQRLKRAQEREAAAGDPGADPSLLTNDPRGGGHYPGEDAGTHLGPALGPRIDGGR